jgi:folate-binding protein YgfZ
VQTSILLPHHRAEGAQIAASDPPRLLTFGDVPAEYRAGVEGCALFDATDRGFIEVSGPDAAAFLHRLLANTVRTLKPGQGNRNLLLSSKGKILFDFDLALEEERVLLSTQPAAAAQFLKTLDMYLFSEKVKLIDRTAEHAPLDVSGPRAVELVERVLAVAPSAEDHATIVATFEGSPVRVTTQPVAGSNGVRLDGGPALAPRLWNALREAGAVPAGLVARDSLRVEAGFAESGVDIDENVYPQEARLERAFSLDKGCYIGQEVVAKIDTYGGLNKRMVALRISNDDPVARGTRLFRHEDNEWRDLGVITSWAYSFVLDTGLALAYVKRRHQAIGTTFRVGEGPREATIVPLPVRSNAVTVTGEFE